MTELRRSRTVAAAPPTIWQTLAAFGEIASWAGSIDHSCVLARGEGGGPIGTTRRIQAGHITLVERIIEFDPPHALAYAIEGLPPRLGDITNRWSLRPQPDGSTVVTLATRVESGSGPLRRAADHAVVRIVARPSDSMLADLARHLERAVRAERSGDQP